MNQFDCGVLSLVQSLPGVYHVGTGGLGDTFFIDEVFVKIQGKQQYLWRAVDQDDEVACLCVLEMCGGVKGQYLQEFSRIEKLTCQYRPDRLSLIII